MGKIHKPRAGSLQFWPRKRTKKILASANWKPLEKTTSKSGILGLIGYKAGVSQAIVKDITQDSLTKNKQIVLPITIIECPPMRVLSIRFYKNKKVALDILSSNLEKELKRKIKLQKNKNKINVEELTGKLNEYDNIRIIAYSIVRRTGIKKKPDIVEIGLTGTIQEKFETAKKLIGKEISIEDVFDKNQILDIHSVTKGKGFVGPVKRFGISLKHHKTEKGVRRPGSLGPWIPKRVSFRVPMAGQLGFFKRTQYNNKIIEISKEPKIFKNYGITKNPYLLIKGSVAGTAKRPVLLTYALRPTKRAKKESFELIKL